MGSMETRKTKRINHHNLKKLLVHLKADMFDPTRAPSRCRALFLFLRNRPENPGMMVLRNDRMRGDYFLPYAQCQTHLISDSILGPLCPLTLIDRSG